MVLKDEVENFLEGFKVKLEIWDLLFRRDREKNTQTLLDLELTIQNVKTILKELASENYVEGPLPDVLNQITDMWVFGKEIKSKEIYIKISLGYPNSQVICISFHIAESPMNYPLKKQP
jgi:hypothetical protein